MQPQALPAFGKHFAATYDTLDVDGTLELVVFTPIAQELQQRYAIKFIDSDVEAKQC